MEYRFTWRNTPGDFFRFRFSNLYRQWTVIVNIVFTAAFAALIYAKWSDTNLLGHILMIVGLLMFPVIQPAAVYIASWLEARKIPYETELTFDEKGMGIQVKEHRQFIRWPDFHGAKMRRGYLMVIPDGNHAYLLPDRVLEDRKQELYEYILARAGKWEGDAS